MGVLRGMVRLSVGSSREEWEEVTVQKDWKAASEQLHIAGDAG